RAPRRVAAGQRVLDLVVVERTGGEEARRERRAVDEGLEGGARLPARLERAVELAVLEGIAAGQRQHVAARDVERDQRALDRGRLPARALAAVPRVERLEPAPQRSLRLAREPGIERR